MPARREQQHHHRHGRQERRHRGHPQQAGPEQAGHARRPLRPHGQGREVLADPVRSEPGQEQHDGHHRDHGDGAQRDDRGDADPQGPPPRAGPAPDHLDQGAQAQPEDRKPAGEAEAEQQHAGGQRVPDDEQAPGAQAMPHHRIEIEAERRRHRLALRLDDLGDHLIGVRDVDVRAAAEPAGGVAELLRGRIAGGGQRRVRSGHAVTVLAMIAGMALSVRATSLIHAVGR